MVLVHRLLISGTMVCYIEKHKGTDKLVKQLIRHMASIDGYAKKIENLCGNGN